MNQVITNYYTILEISRNAQKDEIEQQYKIISRRLRAQQNNPDDNIQEEAKRKLKILPEAKKILLNPAERQRYNKQLEEYESRQQQVPFESYQEENIASSSELIKEGYRLFSSGAISQALEIATKATERFGYDPNTWALLAEATFRKGEFGSAIYEYKRAIKIQPQEAKFHHSLGQVYEKVDRNDDALEEYQNAVKCQPYSIFYSLSLGIFYGKMDDWDQSLNIIKLCYDQNPNYPEVADGLVVAYNGWIEKYGSHQNKDEVKSILQMIDKALAISASEELEAIESLQHHRKIYLSYLQRKFNGSYVLGGVGSFASGMLIAQAIGDIGLILGFITVLVLYYFSCKPPRYAINENNLNIIERTHPWILLFFFITTFLIPITPFFLLIIANFVRNYTRENRPSNDEYLRKVISSITA